MGDKQVLGARANQFWAHNSKLAHDMVAAVAPVAVEQEEDSLVAAVRPGGSGRGSQRGGGSQPQRGGGKKKAGRGSGHGGQQATHVLTHSEQARMGTGLCRSHFQYGATAQSC